MEAIMIWQPNRNFFISTSFGSAWGRTLKVMQSCITPCLFILFMSDHSASPAMVTDLEEDPTEASTEFLDDYMNHMLDLIDHPVQKMELSLGIIQCMILLFITPYNPFASGWSTCAWKSRNSGSFQTIQSILVWFSLVRWFLILMFSLRTYEHAGPWRLVHAADCQCHRALSFIFQKYESDAVNEVTKARLEKSEITLRELSQRIKGKLLNATWCHWVLCFCTCFLVVQCTAVWWTLWFWGTDCHSSMWPYMDLRAGSGQTRPAPFAEGFKRCLGYVFLVSFFWNFHGEVCS